MFLKRIPDHYYTSDYYAGFQEPQAIQQPPVYSYIGDDFTFSSYIQFNQDDIVDPQKYNLTASIKTNELDPCTLWVGEIGTGIYLNKPTKGQVAITISNQATSTFYPGTYWIQLDLTEYVSKLDGKEKKYTLFRFPVCFTYSNNKSNPVLIPEIEPQGTAPIPVDIKMD